LRPTTASPSSKRWERIDGVAIGLIAVLTLVHTVLALRLPLAPDETYYWDWSRSLDWGYYDQGPVIALIIRASTMLLGTSEIGVRAGIIACSTATLWLIFRAARRLFGPRAGLAGVGLSGLTPMGVAGGFVATYDIPMALAWAWALWAASGLVVPDSGKAGESDRRDPLRWITIGVALGVGILSKYSMILFVPCLFLWLVDSPEQRWRLRTYGPWLALGIALMVNLPNLGWQSQNDWPTFRHMFHLTDKGIDRTVLRRFGDFLGSQAGLMTPLLFLGMVAALADAWKRRRRDPRLAFACWLSAPVLLFFALQTLKSKVEANWAILGWIGAAVAYAGWVWGEGTGSSRRRRKYGATALAFAAVLTTLTAWPELRLAVGIRIPARWDQSRKMYGGRELAKACQSEMARMQEVSGCRPVLVSTTYDVTARLAFYAPGQPRTFCLFLGTRDNQYRYWNSRAGLRPGGCALIVERVVRDPINPPDYGSVFDRVETIDPPVAIRVPRLYTEPALEYRLYRAWGYHPH